MPVTMLANDERLKKETTDFSDFLARSLKSKKTSEKYHLFHNKKPLQKHEKTSLILRTSAHLKLKKYAPAIQPKTFLTLQIFQQISGWFQK